MSKKRRKNERIRRKETEKNKEREREREAYRKCTLQDVTYEGRSL